MIEFENAGFAHGSVEVLRGVTLSLEAGGFYMLLGASGAGKTTVMRLCRGELEPTEGEVRVLGYRVAARDRDGMAALRRRVGTVERDARFLDHLSLRDNVAAPLVTAGVAVAERGQDLEALLAWTALSERAAEPPAALTDDERQRAALARAVILSPELILGDEPTGRLDGAAAAGVMALMLELNRMGKTVFVATHDPGLVEWTAEQAPVQVMHLAGGRVERAA